MKYDLSELYTYLRLELNGIRKKDIAKLTYTESGSYIIPRIFVMADSPSKIMDDLDTREFELDSCLYHFKKCVDPLSKIIKEYDTGCSNYFGTFLESLNLEKTILMIHANCSQLSEKQNASFGVIMVENCPEMEFQKVSKERDIYTVFVFTEDDYRKYLGDLLQVHSTVRPEYPIQIKLLNNIFCCF